MADPNIIVLPDQSAVADEAARRFAAAVTDAVAKRLQAAVALSGGSTPLALFERLAQPPYCTDLPWDDIHIFWADERLVPPDDPGSNFYHVDNILLSRIPLPPENIHRIRGELSAAGAIADCTVELTEYGETCIDDTMNEWPRLDLVLLGLGSDGHTASLFPGSTPDPDAPVIAVRAEYDGRPAERLSLTPQIINEAREILFLVTGESKAEAVAATLEGEHDPLHWPAQRIQPPNGRVVWLLDEAAASLLS